jgi:hypothetical protein
LVGLDLRIDLSLWSDPHLHTLGYLELWPRYPRKLSALISSIDLIIFALIEKPP